MDIMKRIKPVPQKAVQGPGKVVLGELGFADFIFLRAGLKSGYFSFGIEFKILSCMLGFSWQTSENGTYIGDNPLSVLKISFSIK